MTYLLAALLGVACGTLLTWYLLIPVVTLVAVGAGVAGAVKGHSFGAVLTDTALMICILEVSWVVSVFAVVRLRGKKRIVQRTDRLIGRERTPPEYEA